MSYATQLPSQLLKIHIFAAREKDLISLLASLNDERLSASQNYYNI